MLLWSGEATVWFHFVPCIVLIGPGLTVDGRGTKDLWEHFAAKTHEFSVKVYKLKGIDAEFPTYFCPCSVFDHEKRT